MSRNTRVALVGCGSQKKEEGTHYPKDLYTSSYFRLKREYAETCCDTWYILSAEHRVLCPEFVKYDEDWNSIEKIPSYDTSISDLSEYEKGRWSESVMRDLSSRFSFYGGGTVVVLCGQEYWHLVKEVFQEGGALSHWTVEKPFEETSGIGEQMQWLKREVELYHPGGQADLEHYEVGRDAS